MFIRVEETPNPNALKFLPENFSIEECVTIENIEDAQKKSPIAFILFQIDGIKQIHFADNYISILKSEDFDWSILRSIIISLMTDFFAKNYQIFTDDSIVESKNIEDLQQKYNLYDDDFPETIEQIKEILETRVNPGVSQDGGEIIYIAFKNGILYVKLNGACAGCPSSSVTLKDGIRSIMQYYISEVLNVEEVK